MMVDVVVRGQLADRETVSKFRHHVSVIKPRWRLAVLGAESSSTAVCRDCDTVGLLLWNIMRTDYGR